MKNLSVFDMAGTGQKIFRTIMTPIQRLPLGFHYFWGSVFAWVAEHLLQYRKNDITVNLSRSFPEKKYQEIKTLVHESYVHIGEIFAEAMWFGGFRGRAEKLRSNGFCRVTEGADDFIDTFENGHGVMVLTSHFGNWEIAGGLLEYFRAAGKELNFTEDDVCIVYKTLNSHFWDEFLGANRCAAVSENYKGYIDNQHIMRYIVEHKNDKKIYIFPTDQHPYLGASREVIPSFMHQETKVMTGATALACKLKLPVFVMAVDRVERGKYEIHLRKLIEDASTSTPKDIMAMYYGELEKFINSNPQNYLWSHRRWK